MLWSELTFEFRLPMVLLADETCEVSEAQRAVDRRELALRAETDRDGRGHPVLLRRHHAESCGRREKAWLESSGKL